jgi:hypothetical protein
MRVWDMVCLLASFEFFDEEGHVGAPPIVADQDVGDAIPDVADLHLVDVIGSMVLRDPHHVAVLAGFISQVVKPAGLANYIASPNFSAVPRPKRH